MIIVGAGAAGASAAVALRDNGWGGDIVVLSGEAHAPYERPPLSKAVITDGGEAILPLLGAGARFAELAIDHRAGVHAIRIDAQRHEVHVEGAPLAYERLLLATGARPRKLTVPGHGHVRYLRDFADALALRAAFVPGARIAIVGGGFIGLELAASARACGCHVTLVEFAATVLMRGVPAAIGDFLAARHRAEGIDLRLGASVASIETDGTLILSGGDKVQADCVIAGIGAFPDVALAESAGLAIDNGIAVDAQLRTSLPDIFAAGDCCSFPVALYGGRRVRLEAWRNGLDQGKLAARNMLGGSETYAAVPWFWSDQYDVHVQIAGLADGAAQDVARELGEDARLIFHLDGQHRLLAASGAGPIGKIAKNIKMAEMLVARRAICNPHDLASPGFALKSLLAQREA